MNDKAWKDYMEVPTAADTMREEDSTQSILGKVKACRKKCYKQNAAKKRCRM
jgi:hypothetical protein